MRFKRIAEDLPVQPLLDLLDEHPELWEQITIRQDYPGSAHHDTQCIYLRGPAEFTPESYMGDITAHDYPAMDVLLPVVKPLWHAVADVLNATELGYVLIVKLQPGGVIDEHIDEGAYAEYYSRFHIALNDKRGATLTVDGRTQYFAPGECWQFNHRLPHNGCNASDTPRIHLIFDAVHVPD